MLLWSLSRNISPPRNMLDHLIHIIILFFISRSNIFLSKYFKIRPKKGVAARLKLSSFYSSCNDDNHYATRACWYVDWEPAATSKGHTPSLCLWATLFGCSRLPWASPQLRKHTDKWRPLPKAYSRLSAIISQIFSIFLVCSIEHELCCCHETGIKPVLFYLILGAKQTNLKAQLMGTLWC